MKIRFLTSTPLDIRRGSGTYVGMHVLAQALRAMGHTVDFAPQGRRLPVYTLQRVLFNNRLRASAEYDLTVGFDMDGHRIAGAANYVAALKGVIADEVRFERGSARLTMSLQSRCERANVRRAPRVIATSAYSAARARDLYGLREMPLVVPEPIDLLEWRALLAANAAAAPGPFSVLFTGRLYRRKRVDLLLRAARLLRSRIPNFELRIVGDGPCGRELRRAGGGDAVWLGDVPRAQLAAEYNRASVFCLPSEQEGFGIVLLEAMAAGKPIVAARAAAIPEVVPHAALVEPGNADALAEAIERLYRDPAARAENALAGARWVERFDAPRVARQFLQAATSGVSAAASGSSA